MLWVLAGTPGSSRADVLTEICESVGLIPEATLPRRDDSTVETGVSQLLVFADARATWLRARLPLYHRWSVEVLGARLRAGSWRQERHEFRVAASGERLAGTAGAAVVQSRLDDWVDARQGRGWAEAAFRWGPALIGARWEGPWRESSGATGSALQIHFAASGEGWTVGIWRPRAPHADSAPWGGGFVTQLHPQLSVGVRLRAEHAEWMLRVSQGSWHLSLIAPVGSIVGLGPTLALGWAP